MKYFGYGANKTAEMMSAITGKPIEQLKGVPVVLKGYELGVQRFDQIPDTMMVGSMLPVPVKEIIGGAWSDPESFETYVIRPGEGEVLGTMWDLTERDRALVRDWELVGDWYKEQMVTVTDEEGQEVEIQTEILGYGQDLDRIVDGMDYPPFLRELSEFQRVAEGARMQFLERNGLSQEGAIPSEDISRS
ncbi:MAG: hypothetical protein WBO56_03665 [Microgenomates group bacterium]